MTLRANRAVAPPVPARGGVPSVRFLLATDLVFNTAFYMVIPYLAGHLAAHEVTGAWIGLVLGARNLSQHGLYVIGGSLADRGGYKDAIVWGCALRSGAFALLGCAESPNAFLLAAAATGVASALFAPALKAYLAALGSEERAGSFARSAVWSQAGALLGPLLGLTVLQWGGFRWAAWMASAAFAAWGAVVVRALPRWPSRMGTGSAGPAPDAWRSVLGDPYFLAFAFALSGYAVLFGQLYLALPLAMGGPLGTAGAFTLSAVLVVVLQARVTAWCEAHVDDDTAMVTGLVVMGAAFLPLAALAELEVAAPWFAAASGVATVVLTLGVMLVFPFAMSRVSALAGVRRLGLYFGVFYVFAGIAGAAGNAFVGQVLDSRGTASPALWLGLTSIGGASALGLWCLGGGRRGERGR